MLGCFNTAMILTLQNDTKQSLMLNVSFSSKSLGRKLFSEEDTRLYQNERNQSHPQRVKKYESIALKYMAIY